ncbi:MAG: hypothetical protein AAFR70_13400, partial [Pseudomonadota bacterium]
MQIARASSNRGEEKIKFNRISQPLTLRSGFRQINPKDMPKDVPKDVLVPAKICRRGELDGRRTESAIQLAR